MESHESTQTRGSIVGCGRLTSNMTKETDNKKYSCMAQHSITYFPDRNYLKSHIHCEVVEVNV